MQHNTPKLNEDRVRNERLSLKCGDRTVWTSAVMQYCGQTAAHKLNCKSFSPAADVIINTERPLTHGYVPEAPLHSSHGICHQSLTVCLLAQLCQVPDQQLPWQAGLLCASQPGQMQTGTC